MREDVPCAMLANGPPCIIAGVPSMVWTRFGLMASLSRTACAPAAFRSRQKTGFSSVVKPIMALPSISLRSPGFLQRQSMAMTSDAAVMSNWLSSTIPPSFPPKPTTMRRSERSFMSTTLGHSILRESRLSALPKCMLLFMRAESRLWADVMACRSPVKCRLMSSIGSTCE